MTMPNERTKALRWAHEVLGEICGDESIDRQCRGSAAQLLRTFPPPETVLAWIEEDVACIPEDAANAIERAGVFLRSIRTSESGGEQLRRSITYALRHFPQPDEAGRWSRSFPACTIRDWLLQEDVYR